MDFAHRIEGAIVSPGKTMVDIAERPLIEESVILIGIYAIISAAGAYVQSTKIIMNFEGFENMPSMPDLQSAFGVIAIIAALVGPFIGWVMVTGLIHIISLAFGGAGKFYPQMMTAVSFGVIPLIFGTILSIILMLFVEPVTVTVSATNPVATRESMKVFFENPYLVASSMIIILMQFWATFIVFFGVKSTHKLSDTSAVIASVIPLVLILLSSVLSNRMM